VEYLNSQTGVTVNLDNPSLNLGADAIGDTYISIENLTGSNSGDTLIGDGGDNVLRGKTGADNLQGGGGFDTADYSTAPGAVVADLANSGLNTGDAAGDTYTSIENLRGWTFDDTLSGDGNGNFLDGQGGNDRLDGRGGIDLLFGSGGTDTFVFSAGEANGDTISDFFNPLEPAVGDALEFHGFGTAAQGATFTFIGAGQWQIHSGIGGPDEFITLTGSTAATVSSTDYIFLV
jgi:Ca2+-binding RTX toxin-like protein